MTDLRIVDAPVLLQESITDDVKMPTGGLGNFSVRLGDILWYVITKEQLANKNYVDLSSKGIKDKLDEHIADKNNPHQVTKEQVGLGNVDNTADVDKPVSNAVNSAIITATADMTTKAYVDSKDGDLTTLLTTDKTNLVKAINEVVSVKADKATKLVEYGISDAYTKSEIDTNYGGVKTLYDKNVVAGAGANGWTAELIVDKSGATQQQVNYNGGSKWHSRVGGYLKNERVVLTNGDIVKSTVDGNVNDPNVDMMWWVPADNTKQSVYAEQYGIFPNHPTDQTALIDVAIADTASRGMQLKFSGGTYTIDPLRLPATYPWSSTFGLNIYTGMNILGKGAIFKIKDGSSTLEAPKWYTMFFTDTYKKDWSIQGIIFNGNVENNKKGVTKGYNQAFIGVFNNEGYCDNVIIKRNIFRNNGGLNNIITGVSYFASQGQGTMKLSKNWDISENWHIDCGIESFDFTAVFGMGDFIKCDNNVFYNTLSQTGVSAPAPRNAYEVHGSYNTFNNNFIKSYYNGMIVNSNYNTPCVDIQVNNNIMVDMYQGGIRLWRTKSTAVAETPIKNVQIKGNQIHVNGQLFGTNDTYKGGIWGTGYFNLGIDNVEIEDNTVTVDSYVRNKIAGVLLVPDEITVTGSTQVMSNYKVRNNKFYGTYNGVRVKVGNNCPSFKGLIVEDNEHIDPQLVALIYSDYQSYTFETTGNGQITDLIYRRNKSVGAKNGVVFSGNVYDITEQDNTYRNVSVARLTSDLVSTVIFSGDGSAVQENLISTQTIRGWNLIQRKAFKVRVNYTKFTSNQFQTLISLPPKARIADLIADVVTPFNSDVTPTLRIGTANGGNQYLLLTPVDAAKQIGNANAELGAMLSGGKNGQFASWTGFSSVIATLSYTGTLTAGVIDFYIVVEYL